MNERNDGWATIAAHMSRVYDEFIHGHASELSAEEAIELGRQRLHLCADVAANEAIEGEACLSRMIAREIDEDLEGLKGGGELVARSEARLKTRIWDDPDFLALPGHQKLAYLFLISQSDISHCGVLSLRLKRWARKLSYSPEQLDKALAGLEAARFVVIDHDEEELLVRSFLRNDGVCANFKVLKSASRQLEGVSSVLIRESLAGELQRALEECLATEKTRPTLLAMLGALGRPSDGPSDTPSDGQPIGHPMGHGEGHSKNAGVGARGSSTGSRSVGGSASSSSDEAKRSTPKRGTRIPEDFAVTDDMRGWSRRKCSNLTDDDVDYETEQFIGYWAPKTGQNATKLDWKRTWENWIRKANRDASTSSRRDGPSRRRVDAGAERCNKHPRELAEHCTICDSESRGAA